MTDASAILASLDKFIGQLADHREPISSHRLATEIGPMATTNQLTNKVSGHCGHSGHPKQDTFAGADHEQSEPHRSPGANSEASLARKVLSIDGHSGQSGQSILNQRLDSGHRQYGSGQSGHYLDQGGGDPLGSANCDKEFGAPAYAFQADPEWWREHYEKRAQLRELGGRRSRAEAEVLAWRELEWRWHKQYGERVSPPLCAGCWKPIGIVGALPLIDGNRVHIDDGNKCLITFGRRWRGAAAAHLHALGLDPPAEVIHELQDKTMPTARL